MATGACDVVAVAAVAEAVSLVFDCVRIRAEARVGGEVSEVGLEVIFTGSMELGAMCRVYILGYHLEVCTTRLRPPASNATSRSQSGLGRVGI